MEIVYSIFLFLFGIVLGSFYNVVGLRIPKGESIVTPPSHCTSCNRQLTVVDLVSVFSYIFLRGKCRTCGSKISPIYFFMELITGLLFVFSYWQLGLSLELLVALFFMSLLVIIVVSDIAYMIIPDKVLLFFLPFLIVGRAVSPLNVWWDAALGAVVGFGILLLIAVISKGGMGGGDIKLFFLIGLVLGTVNTLLTLFVASVIGMIVGFIVLKVRGQDRKSPVPFGPSIALAAVIVYFYGDNMVDWYMGLF
ncbi:MAG: prepilin peptidase [Lysinibacillus sp.]|nr:prepilin peptidase [Lysinibacillus sp.]